MIRSDLPIFIDLWIDKSISNFIDWLLQVLTEQLSLYWYNRILLSLSQYFHIHAVRITLLWVAKGAHTYSWSVTFF